MIASNQDFIASFYHMREARNELVVLYNVEDYLEDLLGYIEPYLLWELEEPGISLNKATQLREYLDWIKKYQIGEYLVYIDFDTCREMLDMCDIVLSDNFFLTLPTESDSI